MDLQTYKKPVLMAWGAALCFLSLSSYAIETTGTLSTDVAYHSNIERVSDNSQDDVSTKISLDFEAMEESKSLILDSQLSLDHEMYSSNVYSDRTSLRSGFGLLGYSLVEDFFDWKLTFSRTEVLRDRTDDTSLDDREFRNILRTGPSISYKLSAASGLNYSTNYVLVENSDDNAVDTKRLDHQLSYTNQYNTLTTYRLDAQYNDVIEAEGGEKYESTQLSAGLARLLLNGELSFDAGVNRLNRQDDGVSESGSFIDFSFNKSLKSGFDFEVGFLRQISDTSIGFAVNESGSRGDLDPLQGASDSEIVERERFSVLISRNTSSWRYLLEGLITNDEFKSTGELEKFKSVKLSVDKRVNRHLNTALDLTYSDQEFDIPDIGKDYVNDYLFSLNYRISRYLRVNSSIGYQIRRNEENRQREYEDKVFRVGMSWRFF